MKITHKIKSAFESRADGVRLDSITELGGETQFTAYVSKLGRSMTVGCSGRLTPKQAEIQAGIVAAYLSALAPKGGSHGNL